MDRFSGLRLPGRRASGAIPIERIREAPYGFCFLYRQSMGHESEERIVLSALGLETGKAMDSASIQTRAPDLD